MNGLYAVVLALAHSSEVLGNAQKQAQEDVQAANLVTAVLKKIGDFNNNMEQIEKFLQTYIDQHAPGTKEGGKMTAGERSAVSQLSTMLDKLKADDATVASEQKLVDQDTNQMTDLTNQIAAKLQKISDFSWDPLDILWVWKPQLESLQDQFVNVQKDQQHHLGLITDTKRDQMATLSVKTGSMNGEASALSTKAQSALDQLDQIMRAGFVFLSAIDNQEKR